MNTNNTPSPQDSQVIDETMIESIMNEIEENDDPAAALDILKRYRVQTVTPETYLELMKRVIALHERESDRLEERVKSLDALPILRS
jgi:hypothetical protein